MSVGVCCKIGVFDVEGVNMKSFSQTEGENDGVSSRLNVVPCATSESG